MQISVGSAPPNERPRLLRPHQGKWRHVVPHLQEQRHQVAAAEGQFRYIEGDEVLRPQAEQIIQPKSGRGVSDPRDCRPRRVEFYHPKCR